MAARVDELFADPELADRMGSAGSTRASDYSWAVTAGRLRRLYSDLSANALVQCG